MRTSGVQPGTRAARATLAAMRKAPPNAGQVLGLLAAFVATSMVGGVLLAGLGMPAVAASGYAARNSVAFFDSLPGELATPPLSERSHLVMADGAPIADFYEENRQEVTLANIAPVMQQAIVAIEDSRFFQHGGVDPKGLFRAAVANYASGRVVQGASTLTQQYVKNVLIETANAKGDKAAIARATEQTKQRKIQEIKLAISLEKKIPKQEILNRYLNIAYFGDQVYGVEAAARYYFNKPAKNLLLAEAALLAGVVQSPGEWSPRVHPEAATERRNVVLRRMFDLRMITDQQYQQARASKFALFLKKPANGCANAASNAWYCEYVLRLIANSDEFSALGKTREEREQSLLRGGLTIQTAMSRPIQDAAWRAVSRRIPIDDKSNVSTATVTVEPGTGKILAIAQNKLYDPGGGRGRVATNFATDYQYGGSGGFQTGSTFKPFTLATWLKKGKSLNSTVSAEGGTAPFTAFRSCDYLDRTQSYKYSNAGGEGSGKGSMTVLAATYGSVNAAYVSMEKQLDLCDIAKTAEDLGVHLASPQEDQCKQGEQLTIKLPTCTPSLTLGPKELSPMTMAAAYATFATGGVYCKPVAVLSIKDRNGKPIDIPKPDCRRKLDKDVAAGVNFALQKVLTQGTAAGKGIGRPAAGKTGTTNNSVDTWFVGYTAQRATAVWVGDPTPRPRSTGSKVLVRKTLNYRTIAGKKQNRVYGATFAAPIWQDIMKKAHDGLPERGFSSPSGKLLVADKGNVPNVRGQDVEDAVRALQRAGFETRVAGSTPSQFPAGTVADTSPGPGSNVAKGSTITILVSQGGGGFFGGGNGNGNGRGGGPFP
jgi:membrane peptidoglycan carboxypeptidase